MISLNWSAVRNKPEQCAEFAVCHDNFAWRKHHSSRFGQLKNCQQKCANDSLTRAFSSDQDSILLLFSEGNRVMKQKPEYGTPRYAVVWYKDEAWAILCTPSEAVLISSSTISSFKREESGVAERIVLLTRLWEASEPSLKLPLSQVVNNIA